jgi:hypothetical protein
MNMNVPKTAFMELRSHLETAMRLYAPIAILLIAFGN